MNGTNQLFLLAVDAHRTAQSHGFWEVQTSRNPIATKVALIHTEIDELQDALSGDGDPLEELADVVIRALDLAVAIDVNVSAYSRIISSGDPGMEPPDHPLYSLEDTALLSLHSCAARVTTSDRRGEDAATATHLLHLIQESFDVAAVLGLGDLVSAIRSKMARNRERPRLHGRKY